MVPTKVDEEPIFTAIIRDISDRKDAEEKIRRQNEELILLNTIARIIGQSIELNQILSSALSFIMETSGGSRGGLFLPENSQWKVRSESPIWRLKSAKFPHYYFRM